VEPPLSSSQNALFLTLQSARQGLNWRYRDFAIHDLGLFLQNYRTTDTGGTANVAGRTCRLLSVERADQSGSIYTLCVDEPTGLILDVREETREGVLVARSTFESLNLAPDLSGVVWHQPGNNEQTLSIRGQLTPYVGFEARAPRSLPAGYQLLDRSSVLHPQEGSLWVKETFGDGVESLFFLHGGPIIAGNGIKSGVPEIQADLVEVASAAPWTVAQGNLRSERVIALGKVAETDLLSMLRSAME
ncbi:MAG TPA: sigma-E factor regulatory protein RseB domain-containing protein, partial [Planctomycetota bacterium]|nr:sigma-E factor regulatory protein RseB domain-containing protein [Planctomycetota bacterium]